MGKPILVSKVAKKFINNFSFLSNTRLVVPAIYEFHHLKLDELVFTTNVDVGVPTYGCEIPE
jgi:hypothetical protein